MTILLCKAFFDVENPNDTFFIYKTKNKFSYGSIKYTTKECRVADTHHLSADLDQSFTIMRIRNRFFTFYCESGSYSSSKWCTFLHIKTLPGSIVGVLGPSRINFKPLKFTNFNFNANPDLAFQFNLDPDPASQNNAALCGYLTQLCLSAHVIQLL